MSQRGEVKIMRTLWSKWVLLTIVLATPGAWGQEVGRFQFKRGQVLQYKVDQTTAAKDMMGETKAEMSSHLEQVKYWQVLDVDHEGVATVHLGILRLKMQQKLPNGEVWEYDSTQPDAGHRALREQLSPMIGKTLAVLRVDATGQVVEVKSTVLGSPGRYEAELPFTVTLPGTALQTNLSWTRRYRVVLDAPLGRGEKYNAEQLYQVRTVQDNLVTIAFGTGMRDQPKNLMERLPLLQHQPHGEAVFDSRLGLITSSRFTSGGVVEGHQGNGSRYEFQTEIKELLIAH
jgi:hypothetical protein